MVFKEGMCVFGLVYGPGVVRNVFGEDAHYAFEVEYENGQVVPYTKHGIPGWQLGNHQFQTVFPKEEIDITGLDISPLEKVLSPKKIIKLREKGKLKARCPSGLWINIKECPKDLIEEYLEENMLHLFKKDEE